MKKAISLILTIVIATLSMVSATAYSAEEVKTGFLSFMDAEDMADKTSLNAVETEETENTEEPAEPGEPAEPEDNRTLADKWFEGFTDRDQIGIEVYHNGLRSEDVYIKGDKVAHIEYSRGVAVGKTVYENNNGKTGTLSFPYFYYTFASTNDYNPNEVMKGIADNCERRALIETYEEDGFVIEKYSSSDFNEITFFFKDGNLVKMEFPSIDEEVYVITEVDDGVFKFPILALNVTPIINAYIAYYNFMLNVYLTILLGGVLG